MTGKIFRNICALAALVLLLSGTLFCGALYHYYEERAYVDMAGEAAYLAQGMEFAPPGELRSTGPLVWIGSDGRILYDSRQAPAEDVRVRPEMLQARKEGEGRSARHSGSLLEKELF